jgi:hypothetical protein
MQITVAQTHFQNVPDLQGYRRSFRKSAMEAVELVFLITGAESDDRASARLQVEQSQFLHEAHRIIERQHVDGRAEPDPAGHASAVSGHHRGRGAYGIVGEMVLGKPCCIEADLVGKLHHGDGVVKDLLRCCRVVALHHQVEKAEFHDSLMRKYNRR